MEPLRDTLDRTFAELSPALRSPGIAAGVLADGRVAWTRCAGTADLAAQRPVGLETRFRIGSITKTFTALAVIGLYERGVVDLDQPLVSLLPELAAVRPVAGRIEQVTLRQVLLHRAGLPSEPPTRRWQAGHFPTVEELLATLDQAAICIPPGVALKYSNLGYQLLGVLVARLCEVDFPTHVEQSILEPLGMRHTSFAAPDRRTSERAVGYRRDAFDDSVRPVTDVDLNAGIMSGGLWSTVGDMLRWAAFHCSRREGDAGLPVGPDAVAEALRPQAIDDPQWQTGHALGWEMRRRGEWISYGHGGAVDGFAAGLAFDPGTGTAATVLTNGETAPIELAYRLLHDAASARAVEAPNASPRPGGVASPRLSALAGTYRGPFEKLVTVTVDGETMTIEDLREHTFDRIVVHENNLDEADAFLVREGRYAGERLTFVRHGDGAVSHFELGNWVYARVAA